MIYVDTSALVALLTVEPTTPAVKKWFIANTESLVSADWCAVEFASALAAKLRAKQLRPVHVRAAHKAFEALAASGLRLLPVTRTACQRAAALAKPAGDKLRAGDALHLAVALEAGADELAGLDDAMNSNATRLGLRLSITQHTG
jgi:hypothetical protein